MSIDAIYGDASLAELYDLAWGDYADDVEMYEQFAQRGELASLELGVGTGRVALHLARTGHHVVGIDAALPMLARLQARLDPQTAPFVRAVDADMRDFDLAPEKFDLVYCAANTFQHLVSHHDQIATLACVAKHLAAGGVFVVDVRTLRAVDWSGEATAVYLRAVREMADTGDQLMHFRSVVADATTQTTKTTYWFDRVSADGAVQRAVMNVTLRYTGLPELELLLDRSGLRVSAVYGDTDLSLYTEDSDTMILVAELM